VRASSEGAGRGATFSVELPLASREATAPAPRKQPRSRTRVRPVAQSEERLLEGLWVLVVDDERDARELTRELLEERGARVLLAASADEAYALLCRARPDVLVSDLGMPDTDGFALIRRVRELPAREGGDTPAVALTAFARLEERERALVAGFQAHLAKPVDPAELIALVASLAGTLPSAAPSAGG